MLALAALLIYAGTYLAIAGGVSIAGAPTRGPDAALFIRMSVAVGLVGIMLFFLGAMIFAQLLA